MHVTFILSVRLTFFYIKYHQTDTVGNSRLVGQELVYEVTFGERGSVTDGLHSPVKSQSIMNL